MATSSTASPRCSTRRRSAPTSDGTPYAGGFFKDQGCGFSGGYLPFARTRAERETRHDPRPSLEERYQTHDGYVRAVRAAAEAAVAERFLLPEDAARLIAEAGRSDVLAAVPAVKVAYFPWNVAAMAAK